jgi:hypothetical protein
VSDFNDAALGMLLVDMFAAVGDNLSHGQDSVALEALLPTARRYESALLHARSFGYVPRIASSAEVIATIVTLPSTIALSGGATIPAGVKLTGVNGLTYELLSSVFIPGTSTTATLSLVEGLSLSEVTAKRNIAFQEVVSQDGPVADGSFHVFVGDPTVPTNEWLPTANLRVETSDAKVFEYFFDADGKLHVVFGDEAAGKMPDANITLQYRTSNGSAGNAALNTIRGNFVANLVGGGTISLEAINSEYAAAGGRDRETIDELKLNVPAFAKSHDLIVSLESYNTQLLRVPGVALAFAEMLVSAYSGNVAKIHLWDVSNVTFKSEATDATKTEAEYSRWTAVAQSRVDDVQAFLAPRTSLGIHNQILRPSVAYVDVYLGTILYNKRYSSDAVRLAVTQAAINTFETSGGFALRVSDLYNAIDNAAGVEHFYIERMVLESLETNPAKGSATFTQVASYTAPNLGEFITLGDGLTTKTFEWVDSLADVLHVPTNIAVIRVEGDGTPAGNRAARVAGAENLRDAINSNISILAELDDTGTDPVVKLTNRAVDGVTGNVAIVHGAYAGHAVSTTLVVAGMSGSTDDPVLRWHDYRRIQDGSIDDWPAGSYAPGEGFTLGNVGFANATYSPGDGVTLTIVDGLANTFVFEFDDDNLVTVGRIVFVAGANPVDSETITISDGTTGVVFEFESTGGVAPGNIAVAIGGSANQTMSNLIIAINSSALAVLAEIDPSAASPTCRIQGSVAVSSTFTISDAGANITTEALTNHKPVTVVSGNQSATMLNLSQAVNAAFLGVSGGQTIESALFSSLVPSVRIQGLREGAALTLTSSDPTNLLVVANGWLSGAANQPYEPIKDIVIRSTRAAARYYDDTYLYNNEIRYDSTVSSQFPTLQPLVLRRLIFDLSVSTN